MDFDRHFLIGSHTNCAVDPYVTQSTTQKNHCFVTVNVVKDNSFSMVRFPLAPSDERDNPNPMEERDNPYHPMYNLGLLNEFHHLQRFSFGLNDPPLDANQPRLQNNTNLFDCQED
jgi:hypothetical protein